MHVLYNLTWGQLILGLFGVVAFVVCMTVVVVHAVKSK